MSVLLKSTNGQPEIARRAYQLWMRRRGASDVQDWLDAEAELLELDRLRGPAQPIRQAIRDPLEGDLFRDLAEAQTQLAALLSERDTVKSRLRAEHSISHLLASSSELTDCAVQVIQVLCRSLEWDAGALWLLDEEIGGLSCKDVWHEEEFLIPEFERACRGTIFPVGVGLPGRIWATGVATRIADMTTDDELPRAPIAVKEGLAGAFGFPISSGGAFLGVLEFFSRHVCSLDDEAMELMQCIGNQIARFIEQRRAQRVLLLQEAEYRIAREIQQSLVPQTMPVLAAATISARSVPAYNVGGDCFDFFPLRRFDGHEIVALMLADASGHGIGAALVVAETRAYLRALSLACCDISTLMTLTNVRLAEGIGMHFVTLALVEFDATQSSLRYCGAGHCPGFVLDAGGGLKSVLVSDGLPLGVHALGEFAMCDLMPLCPGDLVFLYSDGIVEAGAAEGDPFGVDRALEVVRQQRHKCAAEIVERVLAAAAAFSRPTLQDDMTAVVMKIN